MSKINPANSDLTNEIIKEFSNVKNKKTEQEDKVYVNEVSKKWNMNDKIIELYGKNIEKDQKLKGKYAVILVSILGIQLLMLNIIFILVGCGILTYSETTFNIFITGGIAEIFVLVRIIVKYLFKDNLSNALNIILENNNKAKYKKNTETDKRWKINVFSITKNILKKFIKSIDNVTRIIYNNIIEREVMVMLHIIKKLVRLYRKRKLAKTLQQRARHNLQVATDFYYDRD